MNSNNSNRRHAASARGFLAGFAITPLAALGILAGAVPAARAADTTCTGEITSGTFTGNLTVPAGNNCVLADVTVTGNVQVGKGASLIVSPQIGRMTIGGNLQASQCSFVSLFPSPGGPAISVGGNVEIRGCTVASGYTAAGRQDITISGNFACDHNSGGCTAGFGTVRGNVQVNNNSNVGGPGAGVGSNNVGGNVQVNNNSGSSATEVLNNTVGGNLRCVGNSPGVTDSGLPNNVTGTKQGQCAGF